MATTEEVQKLVMQVQGERELTRLVAKQNEAEKVLRKLVDRFNEGKISQEAFARRTEIVGSHILRLREKADETEKSFRKLGFSLKNYTQEIRTAGYITQDFAQGGFGGILNNIDQLLYKFPIFAAGATIAATAVWAFGPAIKTAVEGMIAGNNAIPETTDKLEKLEGQTKKNAERLKELRERQSLTNAQLKEYNEILGKQTELEREANEERERRKTLEAQLNKEQANPYQQQSAAAMSEAVTKAGGVKKLINEAFAALIPLDTGVAEAQAERDKALKELNEPTLRNDGTTESLASRRKRFETAKQGLAEARRAAGDSARGIVSGALQGDESQIINLEALLPGRGFGAAAPAGLQAAAKKAEDEARSRAFNEDLIRKQVGNMLYRVIGNAATGLKVDRQEQQAARQYSLDVAANMTGAHKAQEAANKQAAAEKVATDREAARKAAEAPRRAREAQLQDIAGRINHDTGGQLPEAVLMDAAKSTQSLMDRGVEPMVAAQMALAEVTQANERLMQRMMQLEAGFNQVRLQNSRMMGGQTGGGGFTQLPMYVGGM